MSTTRYIEIDSTYRNRQRDPIIGSFDVILSQSGGRTTGLTSHDPVSLATTQFPPPNPTPLANNPITGYMYPTATPTIVQIDSVVDGNDNLVLPEDSNNAYNGCVLEQVDDTGVSEFRTIVDYNVENGIFEDFGTATISAVSANTFEITGGSDISDYYTGKYFRITSGLAVGETRLIDDYIVTGVNTLYFNNIFVTTALPGIGDTLVFYTTQRYLLEIDTAFTSANTAAPATVASNTTYRIRKEQPDIQDILVGAAPASLVQFTTPIGQPVSLGDYIWIRSGTAVDNYRQVLTYNATTGVGTVTAPFTTAVGNPDTYDILQFSYDNHRALTYTGSTVGSQQNCCYEITLCDLVLPNVVTENGRLTSLYPYFYVEFQNASTANNTNLIYSNNPHAVKAVFRVPVRDVAEIELDDFISLSMECMTQTIQFKSHDNFYFRVLLPNGQVFNPGVDYVSPSQPNPDLQVSALFGITRSCAN